MAKPAQRDLSYGIHVLGLKNSPHLRGRFENKSHTDEKKDPICVYK